MSRELSRLIKEVKEKNEQIGALNERLRRQKESELKINKENIKLKVQIDMGNYQSAVYNQG